MGQISMKSWYYSTIPDAVVITLDNSTVVEIYHHRRKLKREKLKSVRQSQCTPATLHGIGIIIRLHEAWSSALHRTPRHALCTEKAIPSQNLRQSLGIGCSEFSVHGSTVETSPQRLGLNRKEVISEQCCSSRSQASFICSHSEPHKVSLPSSRWPLTNTQPNQGDKLKQRGCMVVTEQNLAQGI